MITYLHWLGIIAVVLLFTITGILSVMKIRNAEDFVVGGRKLGTVMVSAALVGGYIGGTSTIGTAQMAYQQGMGAIWFTLGAGIGSLFTGLVLASPLRKMEVTTIPELLKLFYGKQCKPWASLYVSIGIFIQVLAQILAFVPVFVSLIPISPVLAATIAVILILTYMIFGGIWGTSMVGLIKLILLYVFLSIAGVVAVSNLGGLSGFINYFDFNPWLNPFAEGILTKLALGFSTVVGFVSTQSYLQVIFSGKNIKAAKWGAYMAGIFIPVIGFMCVIIGLFMRANYPNINPSKALPLFVINHLPPVIGGIILGTLLISVLITGASLAMGISTIVAQDLVEDFLPAKWRPKKRLVLLRASVLVVMLIAYIIAIFNINTLILKWAYLSMTLRGVTVFIPLLAGLFFYEKLRATKAGWSVILAPPVAILWAFFGWQAIHPLYIGLGVSLLVIIISYLFRKKVKIQIEEF